MADINELAEPAMSIWAASETENQVPTSADERRDDLIVKLMDRVEQLEMRVLGNDKTEETDAEAQAVSASSKRNEVCIAILGWIAFAIFCIWFMGTITLSMVLHREKSKAS